MRNIAKTLGGLVIASGGHHHTHRSDDGILVEMKGKIMTIKQRVLTGIKFLDRKVPNWREKVSVRYLHMQYCDSCILGQIFGSFAKGMYKLNLSVVQAISLGFGNISGNLACHKKWSLLQKIWEKELVGDTPTPPT